MIFHRSHGGAKDGFTACCDMVAVIFKYPGSAETFSYRKQRNRKCFINRIQDNKQTNGHITSGYSPDLFFYRIPNRLTSLKLPSYEEQSVRKQWKEGESQRKKKERVVWRFESKIYQMRDMMTKKYSLINSLKQNDLPDITSVLQCFHFTKQLEK